MEFKKKLIFWVLIIQPMSLLWAFDSQNEPFFYKIGFQQNLNSYQWLSKIDYNGTIFGKGVFKISENFNSLLLRLSSDDRKWRDDQSLDLYLLLPYSQFWGLNFSASANNFSDRLSGKVSDIKTNWAKIGLQLQSLSKIEFKSAIGYKFDDRLERTDKGVTYDIQLQTDPMTIKDYDNRFYFLSKGDKYAVRNNNDFTLQYRVKKFFHQESVDSLSVFWTKKRRDNYDLISTDDVFIESLAEENRGLAHHLVYGTQAGIQFSFRTLIHSRRTQVGKYDEKEKLETRSKKEFHSQNEIGLIFQSYNMKLNLAFSFETDNQKNDVPDSLKTKRFSKYFYYISPDFQSSRLSLSTRGNFYLFKSDTLQLNAAISRYRYDTPENNMDDRDEFRLNVNVSETHHFSPVLRLISNCSVNLYHLVYIFGERSANNNWMRIFRIFPQIKYQPGNNISITHHFEILANYVDYDYELGTSASNLKSYVYRRFTFMQLLNAQMANNTYLFLSHKIELEENGKLNWNRWVEYLQTSRENYWIRMNLNYRIKRDFTLSPGFLFLKRIVKQQNFSAFPIGSGDQQGSMVSFGPTLKLTYRPHDMLIFSFEGIRRIVTMRSFPHRFINHFNVNLSWYH